MGKIDKILTTDNEGNAKIKVNIQDVIMELLSFDDSYEYSVDATDAKFTNMIDFIEYIVKNGKSMVERIDNGETEYTLHITLPDKGEINVDVKDKPLSLFIELDGEFLADEMKEDKKVLNDIYKMTWDRINWGRVQDRNKEAE